ncbi:MAG: hypothetical protein ABJA34_07775, partial [Pseudonocardiales bacterium]
MGCEDDVWRTALITLHAAAGLLAFVTGCVAMFRRSWFRPYLGSLIAMVVFLAAAVAADWAAANMALRVLFAGLGVLGVYLVWLAVQAGRVVGPTDPALSSRYRQRIGFTLVALFVGFVAIAILDIGAPSWVVAVVAALTAAAGHAVVRRLRARPVPV